jgi:two-component system response regulator MprA
MAEPLVLLVGADAAALAPRLEASGYGSTMVRDPNRHPDAVLISGSHLAEIPLLRAQLGPIPLLVDIKDDTIEARACCLSSGADDFWLSSHGASDLLMRLRVHLDLGRRASLPVQLLQVGDLVVNPSVRKVKRGNRKVDLTAREYQLLIMLLELKGTVVSREQILRLVWDDQQGAASNIIEVYVRYLRQKLEEAGEKRLIHTVRGLGYCLSERMPNLEARNS